MTECVGRAPGGGGGVRAPQLHAPVHCMAAGVLPTAAHALYARSCCAGGTKQLQSTMEKMKTMAVKRESMRQASFKQASDPAAPPANGAPAPAAAAAAVPSEAAVPEEPEEAEQS